METYEYKKKLKLNMASSISLQFVSAIIGLIIPRLVIAQYGSETNGIIMSIAQLLGYISLLEGGVGGVILASLYKPLAEQDSVAISQTINASNNFFRKIAKIFCVYLAAIALLYPIIVEQGLYSHGHLSLLVVVLGLETLMQYFFGISYQMLLQAGQQVYVVNFLQVIALVLNAVATYLLIGLDVSITMVKLVSMLIFILRPLAINLYVRKKYSIDEKVPYGKETLKQRWDGLGQHIAYLVHTSTDMVVITFFLTLKDVSVYSVYSMVVSSIRKILLSFTGGVGAAFGSLYAASQKKELEELFSQCEGFVFILSTIFFSTTAIMINPFISIYTQEITDISYINPTFALVMILAEYIYIIREPYRSIVLSAGFYRETRNGGFAEAGINILLSIFLVKRLGITGVAIGTLVAMIVRMLEFLRFANKKILKRCYKYFLRHILISLVSATVLYVLCNKFIVSLFSFGNYMSWVCCGIVVFAIVTVSVFLVNAIFNRKGFCAAIGMLASHK